MRCWNCNRELPTGAKACVACEAPADSEMSAEEIEAARHLMNQLPPDVLHLRQVAFDSNSAEEFANRLLVGNCPKCGSSNTGDCENDPEIDNLLVGRCFECGQHFCTECGKPLKLPEPACECWDEDIEDIDLP